MGKFQLPKPPAPPAYLVKDGGDGWLPEVYLTAAEAARAAELIGLGPQTAVFPYPPPDDGAPFPTPMHEAWLLHMVTRGHLIPKNKLEDGVWYAGRCRNADAAQWDDARKVFVYWREKFGRTYPETIRHPEDDDGFDLFWPLHKGGPPAAVGDLRGKG